MSETIIIERTFQTPIERLFTALISPDDLMQWHHAGDGWFTPYAEVSPQVGGIIKIGYSDASGNQTFELVGKITELSSPYRLSYEFALGSDSPRKVTYELHEVPDGTHLKLEFDIEHINSKDLQREGWTQHIDFLEKLLTKERSE